MAKKKTAKQRKPTIAGKVTVTRTVIDKTPKALRKKQPAKPPPVPGIALIDQTVTLLVTLRSHSDVLAALTGDAGFPEQLARDALTAARERLVIIAAYDKPEQLGTAIARLQGLYASSLANPDVRPALAVQKEINRLLGLASPMAPDAPAAGDHHDAAAELAAVREYLDPLELGFESTPTSELARRAVAELIRLTDAAALANARERPL